MSTNVEEINDLTGPGYEGQIATCSHCLEEVIFRDGCWLHVFNEGLTSVNTSIDPKDFTEKDYLVERRRGLLIELDAVERRLNLPQRTATLRHRASRSRVPSTASASRIQKRTFKK